MRRSIAVPISVAGLLLAGLASAAEPTVDQMISLRRAGSPAAAPGGRFVAYTVRDTDWVKNAFVTQVWLADAQEGTTRPLTFGEKGSRAPAWSFDGRRLAFVSDRGDEDQVYVLDMRGGEAEQVTSAEEGVNGFEWSPDGTSLAFTANDPASPSRKERDKRLGDVDRVDEDHDTSQLWIHEFASRKDRKLTSGTWVIGNFSWSPDGKRIAFDHQINEDLSADSTQDLAVVDVADGKTRELVTWFGPDGDPVWSPDGKTIAFETAAQSRSWYYTNGRLAMVPVEGGTPTLILEDVDEDLAIAGWTAAGLFYSRLDRTAAYLYRFDPSTGQSTRLAPWPDAAGGAWNLSPTGDALAYIASDASHYPEVYVSSPPGVAPKALTKLGDALDGWTLGSSELVSWTSRDGATIEGVLRKPAGWKPGTRRPLLIVIHGGPTGISRPTKFASTYVYPIEHFLAKGALVLEPNYRGSAGYGSAFRALNVRNLGVGDAWDVVTGIESLARQGLVDTTRIGVMGWSQGGYISAQLATTESRRFRAISVGAGISDWMTYYVNTDITPFTRQYLKATPWSDPEIYAKTSPITTVNQASAPTLIQHGGNDARVPTPNARELYRALLDVGVTAKLTIYPGFGHGLNKPKALRAAMEENRDWFDRWIWGNETTKPAAKRKAR